MYKYLLTANLIKSIALITVLSVDAISYFLLGQPILLEYSGVTIALLIWAALDIVVNVVVQKTLTTLHDTRCHKVIKTRLW